jgi:hypothetical protein
MQFLACFGHPQRRGLDLRQHRACLPLHAFIRQLARLPQS